MRYEMIKCDFCKKEINDGKYIRVSSTVIDGITALSNMDFCDLFCYLQYLDKQIKISHKESDKQNSYRYKEYFKLVSPILSGPKPPELPEGVRRIELDD